MPSWVSKLLWFVGLWTASLLFFGVVVYGLRAFLGL